MSRHLILVGGGHSHVEVIRRFGERPPADVTVSVICRDVRTPYSGMLPGWIAGHYRDEQIHIDLARLCAWARLELIEGEVVQIEADGRVVTLRDGRALAYDLISVNIGSRPVLGAPGATEHARAVKPVAQFIGWLDHLDAGAPHSIAIVGGGAAGCEVAMALRHRFQTTGGQRPDLLLLERAPEVMPGYTPAARRRVRHALRAQGITIETGLTIEGLRDGALVGGGGRVFPAADVIWTTGAAAAGWLGRTGLALDPQGFLLVNDQLRSVSHANVFAAGDIASIAGRALPKAGVFAVRQGPVLAENLRRAAAGTALVRYRPQRRFLSLVALGGKAAVASYGPFAAEGAWVWRLKDRIDRRFMARYGDLPRRS